MQNAENTGSNRRRKIVSNSYKGYTLGKEPAYDAKILDATLEIVNASLAEHSKLLAKRYDFHLPKDTPPEKSKEIISDVTAEIVRNFNRTRTRGVEKPRPSLDTRYIMVIEQHESDQPHIHAIFTYNGNVIQNGYYPTQEIKDIVERKLGNAALVHECRNGEFIVHRGNEEDIAEVIRATSYIAKVRTKENNQGREIMRSQLNRRKE